MSKQYEEIDKQINVLKQRGIKFKDEEKAKKIILRENFHYLTTGYEEIFLDLRRSSNNKEIYEEETYFEELYAIYKLDRELKNVIFDYINIVESNIKSYISYEFSARYGNMNFFKRENFREETKYNDKFEILKEQVNSNIERNPKFNKNKDLPLGALVKVFTFGNISTFYSLLKLEDKQKIAENMQISPYGLEKYLVMLNIVRNICAHGDILFNIRFNMELDYKDYKYLEILNIPKIQNKYVCGTNDLFSVIIILKKLLIADDFRRLFIQIENLLKEIKEEIDELSYNNLMKTMGFPKNYKLLKGEIDMEYIPNPVDTNEIELEDDILNLAEKLAKNTHEVWAKNRLKEGWKYGLERNDKLKTTPCLVAYEELPEEEKEYDRNTSIETLKLIQKLGFKIVKEEK